MLTLHAVDDNYAIINYQCIFPNYNVEKFPYTGDIGR